MKIKMKTVVLTIILGVFYPFTFFIPIHKKRITFISLVDNELSKDFKILYDMLSRVNQYDLKIIFVNFEPTLVGNIRYVISCIWQLFIIQSSKLVIIDYNNFVISKFPHRKEVKVLEIWHSLGALKKFGNEVSRSYEIKNYDYAIVNSEFYKKIYANSFSIPEENIFVTGIPNNDIFFKKDFIPTSRNRLEKIYLEIIGKKVILYAPTFRGNIHTNLKEAFIDLGYIAQALGDDYIIIYKSHPLVKGSVYRKMTGVLYVEDEEISSLFCIADILITDYSAIAIDWMSFGKPIISFVPDLKKYSVNPGLVIDYINDFPGPIVFNEDELIQEIQCNSSHQYLEKRILFSNKTYKYMDGNNTQRVLEVIYQILST